ncbi:uncharacterized protein LOC134680332 [Cydia fagiglandana]|uniref:uncharacterized protein LOC134680332 n=1 Tax=Cydia fagiglandana TaxID=1458189 RepID=UPI002FEDE963
MLKSIVIFSALLVCCYCEDNLLIDEARAKKKKSVARLWIMIILFIFSKVAVLKVVSVFLFMAFFQKFCYIIGLLISYYMKSREAMKPVASPSTLYGPPADYNTIGYSYGPPESEPLTNHENHSPGFLDLGNFNWPFKRN